MYWRLRYIWRRIRLLMARTLARGPISILVRSLLPLYVMIGLAAGGYLWARDNPAVIAALGTESRVTVGRWVEAGGNFIVDQLSTGIDGDSAVEMMLSFLPDLIRATDGEHQSSHSWQTPTRAWIFMLTGYDLSQPRTFLEASVPGMRESNQRTLDRIRVADRTVVPPIQLERIEPDPPQQPIVEPVPSGVNDEDVRVAVPEEVAVPQQQVPDDTPDAVPVSLQSVASRSWGHEPLVLIFHTHTSESYRTDPPDPLATVTNHVFNSHDTGITRVGEALATKLREQYNIGTIHSKRIHDWPQHVMAYRNARETVEELLARYPSIQLVLDLHRQGIPDYTFATTVGNHEAVAVEVIYTTAEKMSYGSHPNWRRNQEIAHRLAEAMEEVHAGLLRRVIRVDDSRYNQDLHPHMLLLEVGNYLDFEEHAVVAAKLLADPIARLLAELVIESAQEISAGRYALQSDLARPQVTPVPPPRPAPGRRGPG